MQVGLVHLTLTEPLTEVLQVESVTPTSGSRRNGERHGEGSITDLCPGSELMLMTSRCAVSTEQWGLLVRLSIIVNNINTNSSNVWNSAPWPGREKERLDQDLSHPGNSFSRECVGNSFSSLTLPGSRETKCQ